MREDARAGRVGNRQRVDQIFRAVIERMERNVVQHAVRDDDEMLHPNMLAKWREHFFVKLFEVRLHRAEQEFFESLRIFATEAKFRHLEIEHPEQIYHARNGSNGNDFERFG